MGTSAKVVHEPEHSIPTLGPFFHNMVFIHGEEISVYGCKAHILSLGAKNAVYPAVTSRDLDEKEKVISSIIAKYEDLLNPEVDKRAFAVAMDVFDKIREADGLSVLCHMYWDSFDRNSGTQRGIPEQLVRELVKFCNFDAFEIVSGCPDYDTVGNDLQRLFYEENLRGKGIPVIGITDTHTTNPKSKFGNPIFGKNYSVVFVDSHDEEGVLNAIRQGRSVAVESVGGKTNYNGSLRYVKFVYFLLKNYFVVRDRFTALEAMAMERFIIKENNLDKDLIELLNNTCKDTIRKLSKEWRAVL